MASSGPTLKGGSKQRNVIRFLARQCGGPIDQRVLAPAGGRAIELHLRFCYPSRAGPSGAGCRCGRGCGPSISVVPALRTITFDYLFFSLWSEVPIYLISRRPKLRSHLLHSNFFADPKGVRRWDVCVNCGWPRGPGGVRGERGCLLSHYHCQLTFSLESARVKGGPEPKTVSTKPLTLNSDFVSTKPGRSRCARCLLSHVHDCPVRGVSVRSKSRLLSRTSVI